MRQINILDNAIQFIDVDGTITTTPLNTVYTYVKDQTVSFILIDHRDNAGYVIMTSLAKDVQINGKVYTPQEYLDGTATEDFFSSAGIKLVVVDELPETGKNGIIYLVANEQGSYTEYLWLEDEERFEELGDLSKIDLTNYYTKSEVDTMVDSINDTIEANERIIASALVDLNENKADKSEIPDLTDYATKTYVDEAIAEIPQPDLSAYATVVDVEELEEGSAAALNDLNDRVDTIENDYATETYVDTSIAAIPAPDMSNYYTKSEIDNAVENNELAIAAAVNDLNERIGEVDTALAAKQNTLTFDSAPTQNSTNPVTTCNNNRFKFLISLWQYQIN